MDESRMRFEEGIAAVKRLWTEAEVRFEGSFHQFGPLPLLPRPVQQPHPPIWIAAISTEESFGYAARNGFNLMIVPYAGPPGRLQELVRMYRTLWAQSGHTPGAEHIQVAQFGYLAEDRAEARRGFERICTRYLETFADALQSWKGHAESAYPGYHKMVASILAATPDTILAQGGAFVGSPDEVVEQVQACVKLFDGPIEPSMQINFGGTKDAEAFRTLELLAAKVLPRFR